MPFALCLCTNELLYNVCNVCSEVDDASGNVKCQFYAVLAILSAPKLLRCLCQLLFKMLDDGNTCKYIQELSKLLVSYHSDKLSWKKQVCDQCAKSNRMLGFVRNNTKSIRSASVRRAASQVTSWLSHPSVGAPVKRIDP